MFTREGYYLRLPTPPQGAPQKYAPTRLAPPFATVSLLCPPGHSSTAIRVSTLGRRRCRVPNQCPCTCPSSPQLPMEPPEAVRRIRPRRASRLTVARYVARVLIDTCRPLSERQATRPIIGSRHLNRRRQSSGIAAPRRVSDPFRHPRRPLRRRLALCAFTVALVFRMPLPAVPHGLNAD